MAESKTGSKGASGRKSTNVWSDEERAAMQESARERRKSAKLSPEEERAQGEADVRSNIDEMPEPDRSLAEAVDRIVKSVAPEFVPRTYYGMPAYARDGKVIVFFQPAAKFKVRYATLGFQPDAKLDDGPMWPTSFAVTTVTPEVEARITELVRRVAS
jgi:uncharacterized protein YdhG (YjbR/CyaY superfamily)